jgi:TP901 family phage tail tape measure protein
MAKNTAEAEVLITMNGKAAENALAALRKQQEQCNDAIKAGIEAQKELDKLRKTAIGDYKKVEGRGYKEQEEYLKSIIKKGKEGTTTLNRLKREINVTELATKKYAEVLKNINGSSLAELQAVAKQLKFEIRQLPPDTQKFIDKTKQLKDVNTRINQITTNFKGLVAEEKKATFTLRGLVDGFNKYWGLITMVAGAVTGISMSFRKAAQAAAALDDTYADVMKTTGLLHEQVAELDQELMKINTRTSREQLLLLARDAGKLGIQGKENILGFVRAADQIQVALGEDLGEGAIKNLGKIADVFGLTKEMGIEKSLLSIASAVNALGQASTASEAYLVDFTQRLAGVGAMAGLSVQDILGFASGLDQSAMKVEMAATAFQKFLMSMYEEPAKFAKYAGMQVEEFSELLKTNANEAITVVMKAMNGQDGFAAMVPVFNEMGLDGARAVGVLSAMTKNLEAVTEAQRLANVEFAKGTSVTEEYNTKNNNLQAQLEKARKEFQNASIALGQSLNPIMLKSTKLTTHLIKALAQYGKEIKTVIIVIAALTVALKARNIAIAIGNAAMKVAHALQATGKVITLALSVAYNTLANNTTRAAAAQKLLNSAMNASVIGVILTAVTGLTVGIMALTKRIREARKEREWLNELEKGASVEYAKQASEVMSLSKIVHNNNISLEERKRALDELKKIVPGYHADLTEEGRLIRDNTAALDDYLDNLKKTVRMEIFKESYRELQQQMIEQEKLLEDAKQRQAEALKNAGGNTQTEYYVTEYGELGGGRTTKHKTQYGEATDMVEKAESGLKELQSKEKEIEQQIGVVSGMTLNAIDEDIAAVNEKYKELFNEIKEQYRDNPAAGEEARQDLEKQKRDEIAAIRQKYAEKRTVETEETATTNAILTQTQFDYLQERQDKLTKKEKEMVMKGYAALSAEDSKALKARYDKLMKADDKANQKAYDARIKQIEENQRREENALKESLKNNEITHAEYNARMNLIVMQGLQQRIDAAKQFGQDATKYTSQLLDEEIKLIGAGMEEVKEFLVEDFSQPAVDIKANDQFWDEIYGKAEDIKLQIKDQSLQTEYDKEMMWLEKLHQYKLLSEEQFEKAKLKTKLNYAQQYAEQANSIAAEASNFVTAIKEAESAQLEAQYQRQLTAAGDNAERREQIDAEYEQKKLDLQKKYADVDMAINIAKTVANGAAAVVKALADPGGVAGYILAGLVGVTTAAEIATIIAQRNAIKNASVSSGGGSSSVPKTGERKMTGYSEGGFTDRAASDHKVVGVVHANEYVAPAWMVRQNPVTFANLERYRQQGSRGRSGSASHGFADGGFTGKGNTSATAVSDSNAAIEEAVYKGIRAALEGEWLRAYLVRQDLIEMDAQDARFKKQTSRS